MAAYIVNTAVYPSDLFVESCGAILFDMSTTSSSPSLCSSDDDGDADSGVGETTSLPDDMELGSGNGDGRKVCLLHYVKKDQWFFPKGRRNCSETRQEAAVREVREESGYACRLRPVTMPTRAPAITEAVDVQDAARTYDGLTEPFMLEVRDQGEGKGVKLVWWFIAELVLDGHVGEAEAPYKAHFFDCHVALQTLTYQKDRDVLRRALHLVGSGTF